MLFCCMLSFCLFIIKLGLYAMNNFKGSKFEESGVKENSFKENRIKEIKNRLNTIIALGGDEIKIVAGGRCKFQREITLQKNTYEHMKI